MANSISSKKRIKITERNRLQNRIYKSSVRTSIKVFLKNKEKFEYEYKTLNNVNINMKNYKTTLRSFNSLYSLIDKGNKKKVFHKNYAGRKKSNLEKQIKEVISLMYLYIFEKYTLKLNKI